MIDETFQNFNLNISGGNQNWTTNFNPGGSPNSASSQSEAWDSRRGGQGLNRERTLNSDLPDGRGVAAGQPIGTQASIWSHRGQGGDQRCSQAGNFEDIAK